MRALSLLILLFMIGCEAEPPTTKIIQAELLSESDKYGLPIKICLNQITKQGLAYPSRIRLETKDGVILDRLDILVPSDKKCSYFNIYVYFSPKGGNRKRYIEFEKDVKSIRPDNLAKLEVFLSNAYGTFYEKESEFEYFIKENK